MGNSAGDFALLKGAGLGLPVSHQDKPDVIVCFVTEPGQ